MTGNESLKSEGRAQQDKAAAEREVAAREAEAENARAKAAAAEADERAHQYDGCHGGSTEPPPNTHGLFTPRRREHVLAEAHHR